MEKLYKPSPFMLAEVEKRYGMIVIESISHKDNKSKCIYVNILCDCGNRTKMIINNIRRGKSSSCGCMERKRHDMYQTTEYRIWQGMKARCKYTGSTGYKNYGGRGIKVCDRWQNSFANFYKDMGKRPSLRHTLDRINNDGNYEPGNCRWATWEQQASTRRLPNRQPYRKLK